MVTHAFNPSTWEAEASGSLWDQGQPGLQSEFQDSQGYTEKLCLRKKKKQTEGTFQWLRAFAVFAEDLGLILNIHLEAHNRL